MTSGHTQRLRPLAPSRWANAQSYRHRAALLAGLMASTGACGNTASGDPASHGGSSAGAGSGGSHTTGGTVGMAGTGGAGMGATSTTGGAGPVGGSIGGSQAIGGTPGRGGSPAAGGTSGGGTTAGGAPGGGIAGETAGTAGQVGGMGGGELGGAGGGGQTGGASGGTPGASGAGGAGGSTPSCTGKAFPTADPTSAGPFQITTDKNVGPLAGYLPDPIYDDVQQRFNVYRPSNLGDGYCHPVLVWANGHGDNPEQHPPECVVDSATNRWCGTYPVLINQLASHGFVVVASLSTTTSKGDPLPTIVGLNWLLEQAEDPTSPYYHHLDTARIGAVGHSEGGLSTCKAAADPRIKTIATVSGSATPTGLQGPALFICGGADTVVSCDSVANTYNAVTDQPAMLMDNKSADHGGWLYQDGTKGPDIFAITAWFRVQLMDDTANRAYFYGSSCKLCTDNRLTVQRNSLLNP